MTDPEPANILVADGRPDRLRARLAVLAPLGQRLVPAATADEAAALAGRLDFAVALLDLDDPDGPALAARLRARRRAAHTPLLFLFETADDARTAAGYAAGAVDCVRYPVAPDILRAKVRVFVDLHRMAGQVRRQAEERVALAEERSRRAAAEGATRRAAFLAEVSRALADSLDPDTTARTLVRQAVPFAADLAGVLLTTDAGPPAGSDWAWAAPPDPAVHPRRGAGPGTPPGPLAAAADRALAGGGVEHFPGLDLPFPAFAEAPAPPELRVRAAVVVPLRARGRTLGVLALGVGPSGRRFAPADVALAEDLAARAAIALDNARLHKEVETADRRKDEFLSMLAHELRNPLAPIRNAAVILKKLAPDKPQIQWAREVIDRQLGHLVRLVDDLLDVSRITRGKIRLRPEPTDLAGVLSQAVEASRPLIERAKHRLDVDLPADPIRLPGDAARLAQVFTNLLNNAAKYTPEGGGIRVTAAREGDRAVVRVRDTGLGIPADMLGAVFELFTQVDRSLDRAQGGLGIGLTLVKRLVELHGGTVTAVSDGPGAGSEFVVSLPLEENADGGRRTAEPQNSSDDPLDGLESAVRRPPTAVPRRVLLVEDNEDGAASLAALLKYAGHDTRVAADGPAALAAVAEFRPDVVVLAIALPGMDGYEVARRLRADPAAAGVALVAVTGYGRDDDRRRARAAGFDHHLIKPVDPEALQKVLSAAGGRGDSTPPS